MVKEWKKELVGELARKLEEAEVLGVADIGRLPSKQMQLIRQELRGDVEVRVAKRSLVERALKEAGREELLEGLPHKTALLLSKTDSFSLFRKLKGLKGAVAAKPGMTANTDVEVGKGGTGLPPGPAIGDLQAAGIPAKIEKGQIVVLKDTLVLEEGDEVTPEVANALSKLDLKPFELGLEVQAVWEDGTVFPREVLDVDVQQVVDQLGKVSGQAFALAYHAGYPARGVLEMLLGEHHAKALALALETDWVDEATISRLLSKNHSQAMSLKEKLGGV